MAVITFEQPITQEEDRVRYAPITRELPADLETPVSVYLKLAGHQPSFLLESVTGGEHVARYSFIGFQPSRCYILRGTNIEIRSTEGVKQIEISSGADPLDILRAELERHQPIHLPGLPRFAGGLVGYLGYEMIRHFEPAVPVAINSGLPDGIFLLTDTVVVFDHAYGKLILIANVQPDGMTELEARSAANDRLDAIQERLQQALPAPQAIIQQAIIGELEANLTRGQFVSAVSQAREHIAAGDIFQVVLSQRLSRDTEASPFGVYRALRRLNPSPYMFFFDFSDLAGEAGLFLIGASPEMHVRLEGRKATLRPIAGTRPRGQTEETDAQLERDLLSDPKEIAEHIMLVDLARNDLGRVCEFGSVHVSEQMAVERYSHVMHIVSQVEGTLKRDQDAFTLMRATFPAGTVSGAPKIRAMQIIRKLEGDARGPYAGVVGYFAYDGSSDTCITIRTLLMQGKRISVQAGAGIVADSLPENEYQETLNKARALALAIDMAEREEGEKG